MIQFVAAATLVIWMAVGAWESLAQAGSVTPTEGRKQPNSNALKVAIGREGNRVKVSFTGTLQSAAAATGPWIEVTDAVSPVTEELTASQKFYRAIPTNWSSIFSSRSVVEGVVTGPLQKHFDLAFAGTPDGIFPPVRQKPYFDATVRMLGFELPVSLRVRGNSSLQECPFPKLKFKVSKENRAGTPFADAREIKIGTHCAEGGRGNIGRLRDERAAFREALVYETMELMGFVSPQVRRAQLEYHDTAPTNEMASGQWPLSRKAFILEDIEVVAERLGGRVLTEEELAGLSKVSFDEQMVAELELFHTLVGNWDYALSPGVEGLRNTDVIELSNKQLLPVAGDFDLASWVTAETRLSAPREYRPDLPDVEREAHYRVEQIAERVSAPSFAAATARFALNRPAIESQILNAEIDEPGRSNALGHVAAFFGALPSQP